MQKLSAVHADNFSVDVAGAVTNEKCGEICQLLHGAEAVHGIAIECERLEFGARQEARESALRGNGAGRDGVHADAAIAPFDGKTASEGFDSSFRDGGGDNVGRSHRSVGGGDAEDGAVVVGFQPAASAGHGGVERPKQHDADHGFEGARGEFLSASDEVASGVVDEDIDRTAFPDGIDHGFNGVQIADVAGEGVDEALGSGGELSGGFLEDVFATAANANGGSEFEEAVGHGFAESGAPAGDEDALGVEKIVAEHGYLLPSGNLVIS